MNLQSHNSKGTEETAAEAIYRRRRAIPLQKLEQNFKLYEEQADLAYDILPFARTNADEDEAKQTFKEYKRAADGMIATSQLLIKN